jgi:LL-diaminopimelate aminotransferase
MAPINEHYRKLQASYLFSEIARRVTAFAAQNPDREIIRMGIGDVTEPLPESCRKAFHAAIDEMGTREGFHGYGPEQGYPFLREAIAENEFQARGCDIRAEEVFVSDGSKCDSGNIQEIFSLQARVAIPDPVYPVYVDTNVMAGRAGDNVDGRYAGLVYLDSTMDTFPPRRRRRPTSSTCASPTTPPAPAPPAPSCANGSTTRAPTTR